MDMVQMDMVQTDMVQTDMVETGSLIMAPITLIQTEIGGLDSRLEAFFLVSGIDNLTDMEIAMEMDILTQDGLEDIQIEQIISVVIAQEDRGILQDMPRQKQDNAFYILYFEIYKELWFME